MTMKKIIAYAMNTVTKQNGIIMFDNFAYGKIKERIENYVEMVEGDEYGTWECIGIKTLEKFSSYDAPDIAGGDVVFYAGRTLRLRCTSARGLVIMGFEPTTHIDHLNAAYKLEILLVKKSK